MTGLRRGVARAAFRLAAACERGAHLLAHVGAGALTRDELGEAITAEWRRFGADQGEAGVVHGLFPWEHRFYERALPAPGARILVVGSGTGRDLIALVRLGYRAEGVDLDPALTGAAAANLAAAGLAAPVRTGSIETAPLDGVYDAFLFSWFAYSYLQGSARRVATLRRCAGHLAPGGRVVLTYIPSPSASRAVRLTRLVGRLARTDWRAEAGDSFAGAGRGLTHYQHTFLPGEIEREATAAGLRLLLDEGGREGKVVLVR